VRELVARAAVERGAVAAAAERAVLRLARRVEQAVVEREREERAHHRLELVVVDAGRERVRVKDAPARPARPKHASSVPNARARVAAAGVLRVGGEAGLEPRVARCPGRALEGVRAREDPQDGRLVHVDPVRAAGVLAEVAAHAPGEVAKPEDRVVRRAQHGRAVPANVVAPQTPNHR